MPIATEFFTPQEDDLNFLFTKFLLLSGVNNTHLYARLPSQIRVASELLTISVRCTDKGSLAKYERQLLAIIQSY